MLNTSVFCLFGWLVGCDKITVDEEDPTKVIPVRLWTSTMRRTIETAEFIEHNTITVPERENPSIVHEWVQLRMRKWPYLDEIFAGMYTNQVLIAYVSLVAYTSIFVCFHEIHRYM